MTKAYTLREKVYQMFVLSPSGTDICCDKNLTNSLQNGLGGVIFFTKNIESFEQTKTFNIEITKNAEIRPFLCIDEEGGRVERTENLFGGKKFLSARYQAQRGLNFVKKETENIAKLIKSLGFNVNFAPVFDVNTNSQNPIIGERAYADNADDVIKFGLCAMETYIKNGIMPVGKHFPGHGDVNADSHLVLPVLDKSLEELEKVHIKPFKAAIKAGIPAIMAAHLHCTCFNEYGLPSSLSPEVIGYLRSNLYFDGIIFSDDMEMGGVRMFEPVEAVVRGINAGINIFLFRDCSDKTVSIIEKVCELAQKDNDLKDKIEKSFDVIMRVKRKYLI